MYLWKDLGSTWFALNGSNSIRWDREGTRHVFYKVDQEGKEKFTVYFFEISYYNERKDCGEVACMLGLPRYANQNQKTQFADEIKEEGYYDEGHAVYYFKVTEKQYEELTKNYFEAEQLARDNIKKVSYTYEELFGSE